jgi:hypothetical protein
MTCHVATMSAITYDRIADSSAGARTIKHSSEPASSDVDRDARDEVKSAAMRAATKT